MKTKLEETEEKINTMKMNNLNRKRGEKRNFFNKK